MRYMGEVLSETALRSVFECRCEDAGVFVLRDSAGTPLGDIGLRISAKNPHEADVGYALLPQAQGQGYASEALRAICDYGFTTLGIHAINAGCWAIIWDRPGCWKSTVLYAFRCWKMLTTSTAWITMIGSTGWSVKSFPASEPAGKRRLLQ